MLSRGGNQNYKAIGDEIWRKSDKINAELFSMTYGALVVQLVKDYEDYSEVNKQLDKMCVLVVLRLSVLMQKSRGYNIGIRLIEDFLARTHLSRCKDFAEVGEVMSKVRPP